jgi:hypothetical protein
LLAHGTKHLLVHYVGSGTFGNGKNPGFDEAKSVAHFGIEAGKPFEYNYMVSWDGGVFEQAGGYQAQHCKNYNSSSYGVLLLLGVGIVPTLKMTEAYWWLINKLKTSGDIVGAVELAPHYRYRQTICPNTQVAEHPYGNWNSPTGEGSLGNLWVQFLAPPIPDSGDEMTEADWQKLTSIVNQQVRSVLNEGTAFGLSSWAQTCQEQLNVERQNFNGQQIANTKLDQLLKQTSPGTSSAPVDAS